MHWSDTLLFQHHEGPDNSRLCQLLPPVYTAICHLFSQLISSVSLQFFFSHLLAQSMLSFCLCHLLLSSVTLGCLHQSVCLSICLLNSLLSYTLSCFLSFFSNTHSQFLSLTFALFFSHSFSLSLSLSGWLWAPYWSRTVCLHPHILHTPPVLNRSQEPGDKCTAL